MGQALSDERPPAPSHEEMRRELARKFADKCFSSLELLSLKDVFRGLADHQQSVRYIKEDTVTRFLEIPDILGASPVLFRMISYIGAFPLLQDAPAVLGLDEMVIIITLMTERYRRVLAKGPADRRKLLYKSLAVHDRKLSEMGGEKHAEGSETSKEGGGPVQAEGTKSHTPGFAVDAPGEEQEEEAEEEDELVLAAFESLDYVDVFRHGNMPTIHGAMIPADNFRKLVMLLLLIAPLQPQDKLSQQPGRLAGDKLDGLRSVAENILAAFLNVETSPGIKFRTFDTIIPVLLPFMFDGFSTLFERFLFSKNLDFTKHKDDPVTSKMSHLEPVQPVLQDEGAIMSSNVVSQLSFFIPGSTLFHRLHPLYSGDEDGFSMGSFEIKVFNWRAPTLLLVRGVRLRESRRRQSSGPGSAFLSTLPPRRLPPVAKETILFQLEPVHDVLHASTLNRDYVSFVKPSPTVSHAGIAFGCPPPRQSQAQRRASTVALGPVSLVLDDSFEFGCFTHDYGSRGGAFCNSVARKFDFQERFEIESLEVWGCGGDAEAKAQAERWAWEAREAEARRRVNLGTGDVEADRALLEMAGLVGANRSGGSMA